MTDSSSLIRIIQEKQPDEVYSLEVQSHVAVSFEEPGYTADRDALGPLRALEAIRFLGLEKKTCFYQGSSSEMYGKVQEAPERETTPFYPRSPYGGDSGCTEGRRNSAGALEFDDSKHAGVPQKLVDTARLPLREGIARVYENFLQEFQIADETVAKTAG
jgi:hypothetical protein